MPNHPVAFSLLASCGGVLVTTSCNRSGEPEALNEQEATALQLADMVLPDAGTLAGGQGSTVILWPQGEILREGLISATTLKQHLRMNLLEFSRQREKSELP